MTKFILPIVLFFLSLTVFADPLPVSNKELRKKALRYERALGVKQDYSKAYRLYCLAALNEDAVASYSIGWMHFNGRGMKREMQTAMGWFQRSAKLGSKHGKRMIKRFPNVKAAGDKNCPIYTKGMTVDKGHIQAWVSVISPAFEIDPKLVLQVISLESAFNPRALSKKNAQGLMQLIPATAKRFGVKDVWNPVENITGGVAYLNWLMEHFEGKLRLVLAAYNAGESVVKRYHGIPPYLETKNYVRRIIQNYQKKSPVLTPS